MRRRLTLLAALLPLLAALSAPSSAATAKRPILFVHGWNSSASTWISTFEKNGWTGTELFRWSYNASQSNTITAKHRTSSP